MTRIATLVLVLCTPAGAAEAGCACRGGPGFRLPDGRCASWKQQHAHTKRGGYPQGTTDERNFSCPSKARDPGRRTEEADPPRGRKKK